MPFIHDDLPTSAAGNLSPLRSNLEEMVICCASLDKRIAFMKDDMENFGMLAEETYCYNIPEVLTQLQKISRSAAMSTKDIESHGQALCIDESQLATTLYHFISKYRRILDQLTAMRCMMESTGSLYSVIGSTLHRQNTIVNNLRGAIDTKYTSVKIQAAPDWIDQKEAMQSCLHAYPMPVEAWERNY